ncbi:DUF2785 domain-containing protein [Cytobacillus praedii]|uniref:DUF2785 domain-containing protein n=1 Tax=Cytobacillus praedii TaxID=1742358 RepID=UPI002E215BB8|nr:DUF2785 domain-containing protein [Cytobacillus praedii]
MTLKLELINIDKTLQKSDIDMDSLIEKMLGSIGSIDSELRDKLIYNTFGKLIMEDFLTVKQMHHIIDICYKNLFFDIGQKASNTVFTRSFSALVIALIIEKDREKRFLSDDIILKLINGSIEYLNLETDIRGYVEEKGWAHSIAHGADLLSETIRHPLFNTKFSYKCLETIKHCLFKESTDDTPYVDDEEERLIFAVEALMEKGITSNEIESWVVELSNELNELLENEGYSLNFFRKRSNVVNFLRGFYFRLLYKNSNLKLRENIVTALKHWHEKLYNLN